jgi:hypothetical protein
MQIYPRMPEILTIIGRYYYFPVSKISFFEEKSIEAYFRASAFTFKFREIAKF